MYQYIATHHNGNATTFFPASTVEEAQAHLIHLLNTQQISQGDALSIVDVLNDQLIYYKPTNNTVSSVSTYGKSRSSLVELIGNYLKNSLNSLLRLTWS